MSKARGSTRPHLSQVDGQLELNFEEWRPVVNYEGFYEVSSLGRVRSRRRSGTPGGILKPYQPEGSFYFQVTLRSWGTRRTAWVHSLVAQAFLGPRLPGLEVCHGPAGRANNSVINLSYGTRSKNQGADRRRDGTTVFGIRHSQAKLTDELVRQIRAQAAQGESYKSLASKYGVHPSSIARVAVRKYWRHVA